MSIKEELIKVLTVMFGDEMKKTIKRFYGKEENHQELLKLTFHMLSAYMGAVKAQKVLEKIIAKYPELQPPK